MSEDTKQELAKGKAQQSAASHYSSALGGAVQAGFN
jgi:hypothetical protein